MNASTSAASVRRKSIANELDTFRGFDCMERDRAHFVHQNLYEKVNAYSIQGNTSVEQESEIILANVFISDARRKSGGN